MSRKYYNKLSQLLHDIGGKTLGTAIEHFCLRTVNDLPTFLNNKKHALFHLWKKDCCCNNTMSGTFKQVINSKDWFLLFKKESKPPSHSKGLCACQFIANPTSSIKSLDLTIKCILISNVCPGPLSTLNYQAHLGSIREHRCTIAHPSQDSNEDPTKIPEDKYLQVWNEIKQALCEIAKTISEDFCVEIEKEIDVLFYEEEWNQSLKEYTRLKLTDFEENKKMMYVPTEAHVEAQRILNEHGLVYITAGAGDGKSVMSLSILSNLKEKYNVYILQFKDLGKYLKDIICGIGSMKLFCFLVDDAFGTSNAISRQEIQNNQALKDLTTYIRQKKMKAIITMRKSICKKLQGTLNSCHLLCDEVHMVDLTVGKFMISETARKHILLRYLNECPSIEIINTKDAHLDHASDQTSEGAIKITDFEVKQIFEGGVQKRDYIEGFPLTCSKFIEQERYLKRKVDFFQTSYRSECKNEVEELQLMNKTKYSVLVYTLLKNGRFDMRNIDFKLMQKISKLLSLDDKLDEDEIKSIVRNDNYYLKKYTPWEFRFDHDIIFEAVLLDFGKNFQKEVISLNSSYRMVFELFRTRKEREDEVCLEIDGDRFPDLARRLIREMKDANIYTVGGHQAMKDKHFLPFFLEEIEKDEEATHFKRDLLVSASIMASPQLAEVLLPSEDIPQQHKAFSFHVACWFGCEWLHLYIDYFRSKLNEAETQKILANALLFCVEKGHIMFTKDILGMLNEAFLHKNPLKFRTAFKTSCYFGQLDVAKLLHQRHVNLGGNILQITDYRTAICKASLKGNIATVK